MFFGIEKYSCHKINFGNLFFLLFTSDTNFFAFFKEGKWFHIIFQNVTGIQKMLNLEQFLTNF